LYGDPSIFLPAPTRKYDWFWVDPNMQLILVISPHVVQFFDLRYPHMKEQDIVWARYSSPPYIFSFRKKREKSDLVAWDHQKYHQADDKCLYHIEFLAKEERCWVQDDCDLVLPQGTFRHPREFSSFQFSSSKEKNLFVEAFKLLQLQQQQDE
jgi:hypothetical protein